MYLPSYCSFRMTDIWRSFVAQNWILSQGMGVSFSNASVLQKRNFHDLEKDFIDEIPGYINNHNIRLELLKIDTDIGMLDYLIKAYQKLSEIGVVDKKEMPLVKAWCKDVSRVWE